MRTISTNALKEQECVELIGEIISQYRYRFSNEKELQDGIEKAFEENQIQYEREVRLQQRDIIDFVVTYQGIRLGIEIKVDGNRNALLRQLSRYLEHESIDSIFVVGTPYWITNIPQSLHGKELYCYRILGAIQ